MKNYYDTLGIEKSATKDDIKKAFRKLAQKYHPDKSGGDDKKFKEINEAYQILSDDGKRKEYDTYGQVFSHSGGGQGFSAGGGPASGWDMSGFGNGMDFESADLGDIFSEFFGGRRGQQKVRGRDISIDIQVSFADAIFGTTRNVLLTKLSTCTTCAGKGAKPGSKLKKCTTCGGKGRMRETRRSFLGSFTTEQECGTCIGTGEVPEYMCATCEGQGVVKRTEEIKITIPAGMENGEMIRLTSMGEAAPQGVSGDLYVKMHVEQHATFKREASNLLMDLEVKLTDALVGGVYAIRTLDGEIKVTIPPGVSYGELLRVKGHGVPVQDKRGDLLIRVVIKIPTKLSKKVQSLIEELKKEGL